MSHHHHHHCDSGECSTEEHGDHHHNHCPCCEGHCSCCGEHHEDTFAKHLLKLADEAWMEVLKEKIKEQIKTLNGKKLDELAKMVAEANNQRWQHKLSAKTECDNFQASVCNFFKGEK